MTPGSLQPLVGASMIAQRTATRPTIERHRSDRVEAGAVGVLARTGSRNQAPMRATMMTGHVDEEDRAPREVLRAGSRR